MADQVGRDRWAESTRATPPLVPAADIYETDDRMVLMLDMPGVAPEAVDIKLDKRVLTIVGCVGIAPPEGYSLAHSEFRAGSFERSFTLSDDIDDGKIEASMKHGQLKLILPKAGPAPARTIQVSGA